MYYDCIVIGGGPAGITASIYAACRAMKVLVLDEGEILGGTIGKVSKVSHFPGLVDEETGITFTERMVKQAKDEGVVFQQEKVIAAELTGERKKITTTDNTYEAATVILATGGRPKHVGFEGEDERVSYWAVKDAEKFKNQDVVVVGGSDAALKECHYLATIARNVHIVHVLDDLEAIPDFRKKAEDAENITINLHTEVVRIEGDDDIKNIVLRDLHTQKERTISAPEGEALGLFVYIGNAPANELVADVLDLRDGYIPTDEKMMTSIPGVFACGDIRPKAVRQIATAVHDGAIAGINAKLYQNKLQ